MVMATCHQMFPDTIYKDIYSMRVGISTVFKILEHLRLKVPYNHDQHTIKCSLIHETSIYIYGLWVAVSIVFNILEHFQFKGTGPLHIVMYYVRNLSCKIHLF
jgi:hypothetical protein